MLGKQAKLLHLIGDQLGVVDHDLMALLRAQIGEFIQHFLGGLEIQGGLIVAVLKAQTGLNDGTIDGILGVQEVDVAGGHHRLAQLLAQRHDAAVEVPQLLLAFRQSLPEHEGVVADGLDLQIVVEGGDALDLLVGPVGGHGPEQLARLAGAADDQPLPVLFNIEPGHVGMAVEIADVAVGDQMVQVLHALLGLAQQDDMVAFAHALPFDDLIQILQGIRALFRRALVHFDQALSRGRRVVDGPVGVFQAHAQLAAQRAQPVALLVRVQPPGEGQRVQHRRVERNAHALAFGVEHSDIERSVMGRHRRVADKGQQPGHALRRAFLALQHQVGNAGDLRDLGFQRHARVAQEAELVHDLAVHQLDRAHLDNAVVNRGKAGGLKVQHHNGAGKGPVVRVLDDGHHIHQIALHAGDELDVVFLGRAEGRREGLRRAVIRNGHGRMAPPGRCGHQLGGFGGRVHGGHLAVHVQLDALFLAGIHALHLGHLLHIPHADGQFAQKGIHAAVAPQTNPHAVLDLIDLLLHPLALLVSGRHRLLAHAPALHAVLIESLAVNRAGQVVDGKGHQHRLAALQFLGLVYAGHGALDDHDAAVLGQLHNVHRLVADGASLQHGIAAVRLGRRRVGRFRRGSRFGLGLGCGGRSDRRCAGDLHSGGLRVQHRVVPRGRLFRAAGGAVEAPRQRGREGEAPLLPHFLRPGFPLAADCQTHRDLHPENIIDALGHPLIQLMGGKILHGDIIRAGQQDPAVFHAPAHVVQPRQQRRALAAQKIRQHGLVLVQMAEKILPQPRAGDAQGHVHLRKKLLQGALHLQKIVFPHQLVAQEAHIGLVGRFFVQDPLDVQLSLQGGHRRLQGLQHFRFVHSFVPFPFSGG